MALFSTTVAATVIVLFVCVSRRLSSRRKLGGFPRVGIDPGFWNIKAGAAKHEFFTQGRKLLEKGYAQHKDTPYLVQTCDNERLVIPGRFIEELKNLPDTQISFKEELLDRFMGRYTGLDAVRGSNDHRDVVRFQLTKSIDELLPQMKQEASLALETAMASSISKFSPSASISATGTLKNDMTLEGFTSVTISKVIFKVIGQITSRRVIDDPLISRDPTWLKTIMGFTASVAVFTMKLRTVSPILRPIARRVLPCGRRLRSDIALVKKFLVPIIRAREQERQQANTVDASISSQKHDGGGEAPRDFVEWLSESATNGSQRTESEATIGKILFLIVAAMHTSAITAIHALYDLCAHPDVMTELREEAVEEISKHGWTNNSLLRLHKMESFLKESGRTNSAGIVSFQRLVLAPITLSNGFTIPAGTHICAASDARSRDPTLYDSPLEFRAMRFHQSSLNHSTRSAEGVTGERNSTAPQLFSSVVAGDSWFGVGRQACPGRWYASAQIKLVLCLLLTGYELKFPGSQTERPKNWVKDEKTGPCMEQEILVRRRVSASSSL